MLGRPFILSLFLLLLSACGDDTVEPWPASSGSMADYFPLSAGSELVFRVDGDPKQTAVLQVLESGDFLDFELTFSDPEQPRMAVRARIGQERIEVSRLERGSVRVELDPSLAGLVFPLKAGVAFSSSTIVEFLGRKFGVNLFGVPEAKGIVTVLGAEYERTYAVPVTARIDFLGKHRVDLLLAPGVGPVRVLVVSPAVEALGLSGVELRLELVALDVPEP